MNLKQALNSDRITVVDYDVKTYTVMSPWAWKFTRWFFHLTGGVWVAFTKGEVIDGSPEGIAFLAQLTLQQEVLKSWKALIDQLKLGVEGPR